MSECNQQAHSSSRHHGSSTESNMKAIDSSQSLTMFNLEKITSSVYGVHNPPVDFADVSFLIPHEAIRREMAAMHRSIDKLNDAEGKEQPKNDSWKVVYFCEWFVDNFSVMVSGHHHTEETLYFPWVATRAELPTDKMSQGHDDLLKQMAAIGSLCEQIIKKEGNECKEELAKLHPMMIEFEAFMLEHLAEEETDIPPLLRAHFTEEEEAAIVQQIVEKGGLSALRGFLTSICLAMEEWATPDFYNNFLQKIPGPLQHLLLSYYMPDQLHCVIPKRDAPFLEKKPSLNRVKCCKLPFCFPCVL